MLKGALLGFGHVAAEGHVPGWLARKDVEIVAAADARPGRSDAFFETFPQGRWYTTAEELLDEGRARLRRHLHAARLPRHARRGRRSRARSTCSARSRSSCPRRSCAGLPALSAEKERALFTVHNWRTRPPWSGSPSSSPPERSARSGACAGRRCATSRPRPWARPATGASTRRSPAAESSSTTAGTPSTSCRAGWARRRAPSRRRLETRKHHEWPVEDTADLLLVYPAASAEIFLTWADPERANRAEITGTQGVLRLDGGRLTLFEADGKQRKDEWSLPSLSEGSHHPDWFAGVIAEFPRRGRGREAARTQPRRGDALRQRARSRARVEPAAAACRCRSSAWRARAGERASSSSWPPEGPPGVAPESVLLGLPIVRRTALAARRAGFDGIGVLEPPPRRSRRARGHRRRGARRAAAGRRARLPGTVVVTVRDLEAIRDGAAPSGAGVAVDSPADLRRAEDHLLASLVKDTEGFMSRHFERKISLAVSRRLAATTHHAERMTLVSVAIGLFGAPFFLETHGGRARRSAPCSSCSTRSSTAATASSRG